MLLWLEKGLHPLGVVEGALYGICPFLLHDLYCCHIMDSVKQAIEARVELNIFPVFALECVSQWTWVLMNPSSPECMENGKWHEWLMTVGIQGAERTLYQKKWMLHHG